MLFLLQTNTLTASSGPIFLIIDDPTTSPVTSQTVNVINSDDKQIQNDTEKQMDKDIPEENAIIPTTNAITAEGKAQSDGVLQRFLNSLKFQILF